jgi:hypothetical protein
MLVKARRDQIDIPRLVNHYRELVSYDIAEERISVHIDRFVTLMREENLYE